MWNDFNSANDQQSYDLIPSGTLAKLSMSIKPGGYDDPAQGWTGGYATRNATTGVVYLQGEFVVMEGPYAKRKIWSNIGLYSPAKPEYANMGRSFIKGILNSARGIQPKDNSPQAQMARRINGLADLNGVVFVGRISARKDQNGNLRNEVNLAITPEHKDYAAIMSSMAAAAAPGAPAQAGAPAAAPAAAPFNASRPSWAQ